MEETLKKVIERVDVLRFSVALTVLYVFFKITNALLYQAIPEANKEILIHLLGIVEGAVMTIVAYEFGSSKSSAQKDKIIEKSIKNEE